MSEKKNLILRIDSTTHKALSKWAADEFRSINGQIEFILHKALLDTDRLKTQQNKASLQEPKNSKTKKN